MNNKWLSTLLPTLGRFGNGIAPWALFASIAVACWFLAASLWLFLSPPKAQQLAPVSLQSNQSTTRVDGGIFSVFEAPKTAAPQPVVNTNFKLEGVFVSSPRDMSAALISANGQISRYRVGSKVADSGYELVDVSWNQAILQDASGAEVELNLRDEFDLNASEGDFSGAQGGSSAMYAAQTNQGNFMPSSQSKPEVKDMKSQINTMFDTAVNELQSNPAGYLSKMGVMATGDGYEVTNGMNSQIRNNIGLKPGDKVISVNGQSVGQPQQDAALLKEIQQTGSAEIQVQRGSQVITVRQQF